MTGCLRWVINNLTAEPAYIFGVISVQLMHILINLHSRDFGWSHISWITFETPALKGEQNFERYYSDMSWHDENTKFQQIPLKNGLKIIFTAFTRDLPCRIPDCYPKLTYWEIDQWLAYTSHKIIIKKSVLPDVSAEQGPVLISDKTSYHKIYCRGACQISEWWDDTKRKSCSFETSQDLKKRRLIGYWNRTQMYVWWGWWYSSIF